MGGKAIGLFDEGGEADFVAEILKSDSIDVLRDALKAVPEEDYEYVDNVDGARALLAAELVAELMGHESGDLPDDLHSWVFQFMEPDDDLLRSARNAVDRILRQSETRELWRASQDFGEWIAKTKDLAERLRWH